MLTSIPNAMRRILVVEDDQPTRAVITASLELAGYTVTCAWERSDVLKQVRFYPFDLVITDVVMPEIDGTEVISAVKKYHPTVPVIAISGGGYYISGELSLKLAQSVGAVDVLIKPFHLEELIAAVSKLLGGCKPPETGEQQHES